MIRRQFDLYLTNSKDNAHGAGPYTLAYPAEPTFRGTPRQILAEIREFRRISGGCNIGARVIDPRTGTEVDVERIVADADYAVANRGR